MRALRARFTRELADERGLSLVELIVSMALGLLVLTVATSFFIATQRSASTARAVNTYTREASNAMNESVRMLQSASQNPVPTGTTPQPAFQYASATSVRFFTFVNLVSTDSKTQQVQLTLDPSTGKFTETTWTGSGWTTQAPYSTFVTSTNAALAATPASTRTLAASVQSAGTSFTYWDKDGNPLGAGATQLTQAELSSVARVTVTLTVGANASDKNAVVLQNDVSLVNITLGGS